MGGPPGQTEAVARDEGRKAGQVGGLAGGTGDGDHRVRVVSPQMMASRSLLGGNSNNDEGAANIAVEDHSLDQGTDYDSVFKGKPL